MTARAPSEVGYSQREVAQDLLTSLSGSFQTSPSFYLNPQNHVSYNIAVQTPQYEVKDLQELQNFPIATNGSAQQPQILGNLASFERGVEPGTLSHFNAQPVIDIYGSVEGTDLASVAGRIENILRDNESKKPPATQINLRGQIETMHSSFQGLSYGLLFSIVLVYALIVVNFQSWLDPFIIIAALPGALAGIVWMLFLTGTRHQRPRAHRLHHVHGRGHGQLDPGGQLRQGADGAWHERGRRRRSPPASRASGPSL